MLSQKAEGRKKVDGVIGYRKEFGHKTKGSNGSIVVSISGASGAMLLLPLPDVMPLVLWGKLPSQRERNLTRFEFGGLDIQGCV